MEEETGKVQSRSKKWLKISAFSLATACMSPIQQEEKMALVQVLGCRQGSSYSTLIEGFG